MITTPGDNIIIAGGGLAGLTCALHLLKKGVKVTLIEKNTYPHHKVCGEYISNEVLPYLQWLDADPFLFNPALIKKLSLSSNIGKILNCDLPLGGFGLSRFTLDHFLYQKALQGGCNIIFDRVNNITFTKNQFKVETDKHGILECVLVVGAYGKRSTIDQKLARSFTLKKSPTLAVKAHYMGEFPEDLIALHNFKGGYCGVSRVENNHINICYLVDYNSFKIHKNINDFQQDVLYKNPRLEEIFQESTMIFEQPLSIGQVSFAKKKPVENHILMIGDTAGLIHPLCGNGMAMAILSAKICSELSIAFLDGTLGTRESFEKQYTQVWNSSFKNRLLAGRLLSRVIRNDSLFNPMHKFLVKFPSTLPLIIKMTHGKPILCD